MKLVISVGSTVALWLALFAVPGYAQTITGTVVDPNAEPIPNARVSIRGGLEVATDERGNFTLATNPDSILRVSASGFAVFERRVGDLPTPIVIELQPSTLREDVVVNITRSGTRLGETPASIVVLDRPALEMTAAQTIDDSLRQVAGFTLFRRSSSKTTNPTTQGANLRGIGGSGAARTAVLFDGVSLNDAFGGWTYWSRVPVIAVEQVEVLRGGASSLYGSSSLSGAINLEKSNERPALRIETSAGSQDTYAGSIYTAYGFRDWSFALAAESFSTAGYFPMSPEERGSADTRANSRHNSGLLSLERRFNTAFRVFIRGNLLAERRDNGTSLTNNRTYFRQAVLGADHTTARLGTFQFRSSIDAQVYDQTFSAVAAGRNAENLTRVQRVPSRSTALGAFWSRPISDHTISVSADAREVRGYSDEVAVSNDRPTALISSGGREFTFGIFAQDLWRVTERLTLNFGVRFDRWRNFDARSNTQSLTNGQSSSILFPDRGQQRFSGRAAGLYQIGRGLSFFAAYNSSFRAPSLNELYRAFRVGNVATIANENLSPETADTIETGASFTGFSKRLNVRGNFFVTEVTDPVVSVTLSATPSLITRQRQNVGLTRTRGLELDAEFSPASRIRFSASYLFADSRIAAFPANPVLVDKMLPQIPQHQFTFQASFRPNNRAAFSIQGRVSDAQFDDDLNLLRLRPFFTLDAFASYRVRRMFDVFAVVENLTNNRYDIGLTPNRTIAAPRFVRIGVRFHLMRNPR